MSDDSNDKDLIDLLRTRSEKIGKRSADRGVRNSGIILKKIKRQESISGLLKFGILRFWMMILQIATAIYAKKNNSTFIIKR